MPFEYEYARAALSVDCVIFRADEVLLIERGGDPFKGQWALPGGFHDVGESLREAANRELVEETGLERIVLKQIGAFGNPDRDPREHVVSVAFWGEAEPGAIASAGDDARKAEWWPLDELPTLAFDHLEILAAGLAARERSK